MPVWIGKIERDKGAADIRQSLSMRNNICGRHCSLELSFYRFLSTSAHRWTPAMPGTPTPCVPFKSGRPPAQGERGSAKCVMLPHTACRRHPRFALHPDFPSSPGCRACAAVSPATSAAASYNQTFYRNYPPLIEKSFSVRNRHSRWLSARSSASGLISQGCTEFLRDFTDRR